MDSDPLALVADPARLAALRASGLAEPSADEACDRIVRLASLALGTASATLIVLDETGEFAKAARGSASSPVMRGWRPVRPALWQALGPESVVTVDNGWAAAAIRSRDAHLLGCLYVEGPGTRQWTREEIDALVDLAAVVETEIASRADVGGHAEDLLLHDARMLALLESVDAGVAVEDDGGRLRYVNDAFCRLFGISAPSSVLIGVNALDAAEHAKSHFPDPEAYLARMASIRERRLAVRRELLPLADGRSIELAMMPVMLGDQARGRAWVYRDVSDREQLRQRLGEQTAALRAAALVDDATGLYNHRGLLTIGMEQLKLAARHGMGALLFFVDVHDPTAPLPGEPMMKRVGELLTGAFRGTDLVARMGSEAFVALAIGATEPDAPLARIRERAEALGGVSLSVGHLAWEAKNGVPLETLLASADSLLQAVRQRRRAGVG